MGNVYVADYVGPGRGKIRKLSPSTPLYPPGSFALAAGCTDARWTVANCGASLAGCATAAVAPATTTDTCGVCQLKRLGGARTWLGSCDAPPLNTHVRFLTNFTVANASTAALAGGFTSVVAADLAINGVLIATNADFWALTEFAVAAGSGVLIEGANILTLTSYYSGVEYGFNLPNVAAYFSSATGVALPAATCAPGSYFSDTCAGLASCAPCAAAPGYACDPGAGTVPVWQPCDGSRNDVGLTDQVAAAGVVCPAGTYCEGGTARITPCAAAPGSFCGEGTAVAGGAACPAGHSCAGGSAAPSQCAAGTYAGSGAATCSACSAAPGYYYDAGSALEGGAPCPAGRSCSGGAAAPVQCTAGTYAAAVAGSCSACTAASGFFCDTGATTPGGVACSAGSTCAGGTALPAVSSTLVRPGIFSIACTSALGAANLSSTTTFFATGGLQAYTVPSGVTFLAVLLVGGGGGGGTKYMTNSARGGAGALVYGTLAVTPGETLAIIVGGGGGAGPSRAGGFGGGGAGGRWDTDGSFAGGGGGGRSAIRRGAADVATAGGGGGGSGGQRLALALPVTGEYSQSCFPLSGRFSGGAATWSGASRAGGAQNISTTSVYMAIGQDGFIASYNDKCGISPPGK